MKTGIELISEERERHFAEWSAEHDDQHIFGELAFSASHLALKTTAWYPAFTEIHYVGDGNNINYVRPAAEIWGLTPKYKGDRIKQLVVAGALIAAEIDRLQRASVNSEVSNGQG